MCPTLRLFITIVSTSPSSFQACLAADMVASTQEGASAQYFNMAVFMAFNPTSVVVQSSDLPPGADAQSTNKPRKL